MSSTSPTRTRLLLLLLAAVTTLWANPVPIDIEPENHAPAPSEAIRRLGSRLRVGEPWQYRNLSIFPLSLSDSPELAGPLTGVVPLDQAIDRGRVEVREKGTGEVNTVRLRNQGKSYVFGLAGDMIVGAKQDRMLQHDILIPPGSGWLEAEVYCTEHGRWQEQTDRFGSIQRVVPGAVRATASQTESQQEVWAGVAAAKSALGDRTGTSALQSIYSDPAIQERAQGYLDRLAPMPGTSPGTIGVLVAVGDRILCCDVFAGHALLEAVWDKLLRSYVMDALSRNAEGRLSRDEARAFVRELRDAGTESRTTPGAGRAYRVRTDAASGAALVFDRQVVHLDLFPDSPRVERRGSTPSLDFRRHNR
jgi:hypothetical protein